MRRKSIPWSRRELAELRRLYPTTPTVKLVKRFGRPLELIYSKANHLGIHKTAEYFATPASGRLQKGSTVGVGGRFRPGQIPANKGLRRPGWFRGRMRETQFKKGQQANPAKAERPLGTERVNADGYLERKVTHEGRGAQRWRAVHLILWEEREGPVPPGHAVAFKNRDKTDVRFENLELITRAELMRRNSYHTNFPKELALVVQARGALIRQINQRGKRENQAR